MTAAIIGADMADDPVRPLIDHRVHAGNLMSRGITADAGIDKANAILGTALLENSA